MDALSLLKLAWPLFLIQLGFQIYALLDLFKIKKTRNLTVPIWAIIIVLTELLGPIAYYIFGRSEEA